MICFDTGKSNKQPFGQNICSFSQFQCPQTQKFALDYLKTKIKQIKTNWNKSDAKKVNQHKHNYEKSKQTQKVYLCIRDLKCIK